MFRTNEFNEPNFDRAPVALGFDVEQVHLEYGFCAGPKAGAHAVVRHAGEPAGPSVPTQDTACQCLSLRARAAGEPAGPPLALEASPAPASPLHQATAQGEPIPVEVNITPLSHFTESGRGYIVSLTDLREQMRAEARQATIEAAIRAPASPLGRAFTEILSATGTDGFSRALDSALADIGAPKQIISPLVQHLDRKSVV